MTRKYGINGRTNAFLKNKENWNTIIPNIKKSLIKNLTKNGLDSPILFLNMQPSTAIQRLLKIPSLKKKKATLLFYKQILNGLSRYRRWLSTLVYTENNQEVFFDINLDLLKLIEEGSSFIKKKGFYTPKSLIIYVYERDSTLVGRAISSEMILKVKEVLLAHCKKKFTNFNFPDGFIKKICEIGFEINDQLENTPLITKTLSTLAKSKSEIEPFFSKIPNNFGVFLKKLQLPFSFSSILKECIDRPLILRRILDEKDNSRMKKIIISFFEKLQALILGKEILANSDEQKQINEINFFRSVNNTLNVQLQTLLENYALYLKKASLFFFNEEMNFYKKIYIWIFLIQDYFYCLKTREGVLSLNNKISKLVRLFKTNNSPYATFLSTKKIKSVTDLEQTALETKVFLCRLLFFILLEPFSTKSINIGELDCDFLSKLELNESQRHLMNCIGIFNILTPHPILEFRKNAKTPSSLGFNENKKSVRISLRGMNPAILIKIQNDINSYYNYQWFALSIYEAISAINETLNLYYLSRFKGISYKIRLKLDGIMLKYEENLCGLNNFPLTMNLKFNGNSYEISALEKEKSYMCSIKNASGNVCKEFINRIFFLLNETEKIVSVNKNTAEIEFSNTIDESKKVSHSSRLSSKKGELPTDRDLWDDLCIMNGIVNASMYIINKVDITIYEVELSYLTNEVFFPLSNLKDDSEKNIPSMMLAQSLMKMLNSSLNLYAVSGLNTIFTLDLNNECFSNIAKQYNKKLFNVAKMKNPIFDEISKNSFEGHPVTNAWKLIQQSYLKVNDRELVKFFKTIRKNIEF